VPRTHTSQNHQQDSEHDMDPLSHRGSVACSRAEIENTCAAVAHSTSRAGARKLQPENICILPVDIHSPAMYCVAREQL
jgi:hypothetical protein